MFPDHISTLQYQYLNIMTEETKLQNIFKNGSETGKLLVIN